MSISVDGSITFSLSHSLNSQVSSEPSPKTLKVVEPRFSCDQKA